MRKETNKQYWKIEEFYLDQTPSQFVIQTAWMQVLCNFFFPEVSS